VRDDGFRSWFQWGRITAALLGLLLAACVATDPHATTLALVRGDLLPLDHPWTVSRLEVEAGHDPTVRAWLADNGMPDYMLVESLEKLRFFYVESDRMVVFQRRGNDSPSRSEVAGIRALYHARFTDAHREALAELRFSRAGLVMNPQWKDPRPASEREADLVSDLFGTTPWMPGDRGAPSIPAPLEPPTSDEEEIAFSASASPDLAFQAWSRSPVVAFGAWATATGAQGLTPYVASGASMPRWWIARTDSVVRVSRSTR